VRSTNASVLAKEAGYKKYVMLLGFCLTVVLEIIKEVLLIGVKSICPYRLHTDLVGTEMLKRLDESEIASKEDYLHGQKMDILDYRD